MRPAAGQARADAAQRPDDARRAMLAEALEVLDRPGGVLLLPFVRRPFESGLVRGVLLGAVLVAVVGLGLPQWVCDKSVSDHCVGAASGLGI
ncbi:hypothetical protein [Streptomyces sp. ICC1]|uniref:hypothetical protein n=2 Tax=unclassified Streptomyces TaxID=2593676 RepID=UPI000DC7D8D5|nr:hypothetical protein [Streptomyces sp. ICC1]AWZ09216.1 hypothetical protein DRB89_37280 [Streptomyces sp. ICC4]AWZ16940.1 hypothetical protein DRB96_37615 [Streptomyces sp. ICC1]